MSILSRGIRNAFRNTLRTTAVIIIIGLTIGLSLVMLIANRAVDQKITSTLGAIGTTIVVTPAGFSNNSSLTSALSDTQLATIATQPHITSLTRTLSSQLQPEGTTNEPQTSPGASAGSQQQTKVFKTNLLSPFSINCDSGPCTDGGAAFRNQGSVAGPKLPKNFSLPINTIGSSNPTDPRSIAANKLTIIDGSAPDGTKDSDQVLVSKAIADKNNLKVGSTFKAFDTTLKVAGIFESDTRAGNGAIIFSLPTLQRLSGQKTIVTQATATVDSLTHLQAATDNIKAALKDSADVISRLDEAKSAIGPLESVRHISFYSLIGATGAGAVTLLLIMAMIVRERTREIGVLKAIGFGNGRIALQFITEALTLTLLASVVGLGIGILAGSPVTSALVASSKDTGQQNNMLHFDGYGISDIKNVQAVVGWETVVFGLLVAIAIALISSTITSLCIAKIKPAEVLRSE